MPDPDALHERLNAALTARRAKSTLRSLERPEDYDPSNLVDLSSNDYLSLARSSTLQSSLKSAIASHEGPLYGPASSRLLDGNTPLHISLEKELRDFFVGGTEEGKRTKGKGRGRDAGPEETKQALLFNSGFDANVGIFSCLPSAQDAIVFDELIHASCHDGMRHSRARTKLSFKHNAPKDLERVLVNLINQEIATTTSSSSSSSSHYKSGSSQVYVAVESLYSMDGDLAPLKEFLEITERLFPRGNCHLIVDEAHTTGLCGPQGRGLACALSVQDRVLVRLHTFGKAMSCGGGVIICSAILRNYFINYARPLIYSTVMSNTAALTVRCSLRYLREGQADEARLRLHDLARYTQDLLRRALQDIPFLYHYDQTLIDGNGANESLKTMASPIIPVLTRHPRPLSRYLIANGYLVRPIAHPTVPKGQERIRICLHSANTESEVESLVKLIVAWSHTEEAKQLFAQPLALAKL